MQGLLLAVCAFVFCVAQGRQALHGFDAYEALVATQDGVGRPHGHFLYIPLARAAWTVLSPFVPGAFEAMRVLSAAGVACGVFCAHRCAIALRLRHPATVAVAVAVLPAAVYFGATVEVDGLVLGASSLGFWLWGVLARRRGIGLAAGVGAATGLAAGLHGGMHLMCACACVLFASRVLQRAARRRTLQQAWRGGLLILVAVATHFAIFAAAAAVCGHRGQAAMAANAQLLSLPLDRVPVTLAQEWLLPYAPFSLLWLGCFRRRSLRWVGGAFASCLLGYLALTTAVMGFFEPLGPELCERGSFLIGIAVPMVVLAAASLSHRLLLAAVVVAAVIAVVDVRRADWSPAPAGFAAALRDLAAREPLELWTSGLEREAGWVRKQVSSVNQLPVPALAHEIAVMERYGLPVDAVRVAIWFDQRYDVLAAQGLSLLMTDEAMAAMRTDADARIRSLIEQHVPQHYRLEAVEHPPLRAWRVRRL
jgi:hypothetical protein